MPYNNGFIDEKTSSEQYSIGWNSLGDKLGDLTAETFRLYGCFVARHPGKILIAMLLFTVLSAPGIAMIRINLDLYKLFVPLGAPVRIEFDRQKIYDQMPAGNLDLPPPPPSLIERPASAQLSETTISEAAENELRDIPKRSHQRVSRSNGILKPLPEHALPQSPKFRNLSLPFHHDILRFYVVHKNYENLLISDTLGRLYEYTNEMMLVKMEYEGEQWTFEDFCSRQPEQGCNNDLNIWLKHAENLFRSNGSRNNPNLQLSYPVMYLFNRPKEIGNIIYGVNVTGPKHEIVGARVLTIHWFIAFPTSGSHLSAYREYRDRLVSFWEEKTEVSFIKFIPHNDKAMDDELRLIIETAVPFAIPATIQLMLFVYFTNISSNIRKSKPGEAFMGVVSVCLSLVSTFGITFYFGLPFNPVSSTMPFLILAVGVDDAFLLLGAWRMTNTRWPIEKRMGSTMSDAGASITVTSLTNFGCFALGYWLSPTPAVADFCVLTAVGVFMDYFYQITFFCSCMVYGGMREEEGGLSAYFKRRRSSHNTNALEIVVGRTPTPSLTSSKQNQSEKDGLGLPDETTRKIESTQSSDILHRHFDDHQKNKESKYEKQACSGTIDEASKEISSGERPEIEEPTFMHRFFGNRYAPFILRREIKAISCFIFFVYVCVSFYGCTKMRVDISPKKYIRDNSPIQTFVYLADKYIWADNVMPSIHIMRPPDFRNFSQRARFNEMVFRLENTQYSIGRVSTNLWVWEYQSFLNDFPEVEYSTDFYKRFYLRNFFSQFDYQQFRSMVKIDDSKPDGEQCIYAFKFQTSFYGLNSWDKRQAELFRWRKILEQFPEFDAFLAGIFSPFLIDQRRTIAPSSMQSVGSAVAVMTLISFFFLPDKQSVFVMSFSLISISMGVCGFLCLWGSDLDSVSMGCIIMAIGLAVDFSIHFCYRYHRCSIEAITAEQKVIETLSIVGYPVLQAGTSTLWAMTTLPFVPAYLVRVFFQTVVLVCTFGLVHALIWLPQFISALDPIERIPRRIKYPRHLD